jgi:hypothetical protein
MKQFAGLALGKAQIRRADLGQLAGQAQLVQLARRSPSVPLHPSNGGNSWHATYRWPFSTCRWGQLGGGDSAVTLRREFQLAPIRRGVLWKWTSG